MRFLLLGHQSFPLGCSKLVYVVYWRQLFVDAVADTNYGNPIDHRLFPLCRNYSW